MIKVNPRLKLTLFVSFSALYSAGLGYWLTRLFLREEGEFGVEPHFLERYLGPIHLIAALLFIFVIGMIWTRHVSPALKRRQNRFSGWLFFVFLIGLALSGITLLYGQEAWIAIAEPYHPWLGVLLLPLLVFHWKYKKKTP